MVVELNRGDLFFVMDHLVNHSNEKAWAQGIQWLRSWINTCGFGRRRNLGLKTLVSNPRCGQKRFRNSDMVERDSLVKKRKKIVYSSMN